MRQKDAARDSCLNEAVGKERAQSNTTAPRTGASLAFAASRRQKGQHGGSLLLPKSLTRCGKSRRNMMHLLGLQTLSVAMIYNE